MEGDENSPSSATPPADVKVLASAEQGLWNPVSGFLKQGDGLSQGRKVQDLYALYERTAACTVPDLTFKDLCPKSAIPPPPPQPTTKLANILSTINPTLVDEQSNIKRSPSATSNNNSISTNTNHSPHHANWSINEPSQIGASMSPHKLNSSSPPSTPRSDSLNVGNQSLNTHKRTSSTRVHSRKVPTSSRRPNVARSRATPQTTPSRTPSRTPKRTNLAPMANGTSFSTPKRTPRTPKKKDKPLGVLSIYTCCKCHAFAILLGRRCEICRRLYCRHCIARSLERIESKAYRCKACINKKVKRYSSYYSTQAFNCFGSSTRLEKESKNCGRRHLRYT